MAAAAEPALSVILPVYNAMPWLPITVRDMLKQQLALGNHLELLCAFDGGDDGSLAFLEEMVSLLGPGQASLERCASPPPAAGSPKRAKPAAAAGGGAGGGGGINPAMLQQLRAPEAEDHPSFKPEQAPVERPPLPATEVAALARPEHRLRVLVYADGQNRGQGAAMSLALSRARALLIGQMESDDERSPADALGERDRPHKS